MQILQNLAYAENIDEAISNYKILEFILRVAQGTNGSF